MKTKRLLSVTILLLAALTIYANPRSKQAIAKAAAEVLNSSTNDNGIRRSPRKDKLVELQSNDVVTIMGYQSGGYAIIGNDDRLPLIIGYSDTKFVNASNNPSFQNYLLRVKANSSKIIAQENYASTTDTMLYEDKVNPLIKTKWNQNAPFNNLCPILDDKSNHAVTGCVATALAQILNFYQYPNSGNGKKSNIYTLANGKKDSLVIDFSKSNYDFGNMLNSYSNGYNQIQANAVAKLMLDCGVATGMTYSTTESSTTLHAAYWAMRTVFGFNDSIKYLSLTSTDEKQKVGWMKTLYNELAKQRPIIYTGGGFKYGTAHAYILDGYDKNGLVHINWGWGGANDGYYNVNLSVVEDDYAIIGIDGCKDKNYTIVVNTPGSLKEQLPYGFIKRINCLKVKGNLNSTDLKTLRYITGCDSVGNYTDGSVPVLDLTEANFVTGGTPYFITSNNKYYTKQEELPYYAFYRCRNLRQIYLPENLKSVGNSAFDGTLSLDFVRFGHNFPIVNGGVYNSDTTELLRVYTGCTGTFSTAKETKVIRENAFHGCNSIETIQLYKKLKRIENRAFAGMKGINKIIARAKQVSVGTDVYDGINSKCILYVPAIDDSVYKYDKQYSWGIYIFNQWDYERKYGEKNPKISYDDYSVGVPDSILKHVNVSFNATPTSPVGIYDLCINEDDPSFELYPVVLESMGNLHIKKNTVTLRADTCFINGANASDYVFKYSFDGLQNNETTIPEKDWIKKPVLELGNLIGDGQYSIIWKSKGESRNYDFNYVPGIAFVKISSSIQNVSLQKKQTDNKIYNLNGQRVSDNYRGIVILNGRKVLRK